MKKLLIAGLFSLLSISAYAGTSFALSIPLVIGAPPAYVQSVPVYSPPVRAPMCWNDYYGQWEQCYRAPAPMPIYESTYSYQPLVTFGYGYSDNYHRRGHYDRNDRNRNHYYGDNGNNHYRR